MGNLCPKENDGKSDSETTRTRNPYTPWNRVSSSGGADGQSAATPEPEEAAPEEITLVSCGKQMKALYNFEANSDEEISFQAGDIFHLKNEQDQGGWLLAVHHMTGAEGYIPTTYIVEDDTVAENQDWWFGIDRKAADKVLLLAGNPTGTFLVRKSSKDKSPYALSVRDQHEGTGEPTVRHYLVQQEGGQLWLRGDTKFESMIDLIDHYKENKGHICCKLDKACPRKRPTVHFRELEIKRDLVKTEKMLGSGNFGEVYEGRLRRKVECAVKSMKEGTMTSEAFLDEARIMHKLSHPKLVQLLAVVSVEEPFLIITELMVHGALLDYLRSDEGKVLTFNQLININAHVADGMSYLEQENFVHRDLRAANILVGEGLECKVADFGLARILDSDDVYEASLASKFPLKWTAPEAVDERKFSVKSDVWSFGVFMAEVITYGKTPYPGMRNNEVTSKISRGWRMEKPRGPIEVGDNYYGMMLKCWDQVPEQRPTFEHITDFFDTFHTGTEEQYVEDY